MDFMMDQLRMDFSSLILSWAAVMSFYAGVEGIEKSKCELTFSLSTLSFSIPTQNVYLSFNQKTSIDSPNYDTWYSYPANMRCRWLIRAHGNRTLGYWFASDFELESSSSCIHDYIAIYDGPSEASPRLRKLCGYTKPAGGRTTGSSMYVEFHSDMTSHFDGFRMYIKDGGDVPSSELAVYVDGTDTVTIIVCVVVLSMAVVAIILAIYVCNRQGHRGTVIGPSRHPTGVATITRPALTTVPAQPVRPPPYHMATNPAYAPPAYGQVYGQGAPYGAGPGAPGGYGSTPQTAFPAPPQQQYGMQQTNFVTVPYGGI